MPQLTVLSMNCLGLPVPFPGLRRRLQALGRWLAATHADVACLQEVGRWRYLSLLRHDEERWPHAVAEEHPYMPKGGLLTLTQPTVLHSEYHVFRARGTVVSLHATERYQEKGVQQTTLIVADQPVVILNTHLAANYSAEWTHANPYARVERAQLRELAAIVHAIPEGTLVIVAGDFNVPRGSWLYHEFRTDTGLLDPLEHDPEPTYRPMPGVPARAAQALDHILVRAPRTLPIMVQSELCFRDPVWLAHGTQGYLSDHLGVRFTLHWRAEMKHLNDGSERATVPSVLE